MTSSGATCNFFTWRRASPDERSDFSYIWLSVVFLSRF